LETSFPDFGKHASTCWKQNIIRRTSKHHQMKAKTSSNENQNIIKRRPKHHQMQTKTLSNEDQNIIECKPKHHRMKNKKSKCIIYDV
jgi:predicted ATP-binding protein involved in virulence